MLHSSPAGSTPPARVEASTWDMGEVAPGGTRWGHRGWHLGAAGENPPLCNGLVQRALCKTHLGEHYPTAEGECVCPP